MTGTYSVRYGYDPAGRLVAVNSGGNGTTYRYLAGAPLVRQIVLTSGGATSMTATKPHDYLNRPLSISSAPSAGSVVDFSNWYNNANRRALTLLADDSYRLCSYDSLGQVISGHKYFSDLTPVAGQHFDYTFDTIGNRRQTLAGGDQNGANQRSAGYTVNNLNQYTQRTVPGYADILGVSFATNTVTVGGQTAYRKGEYFRDQLAVNNNSSAVWTNIVVSATGQNSVTGNVFVAQTPESFHYDADGNLTNDGRWTYSWDTENRLTSMTSLTNAPAGSKLQLNFLYDTQGRRIQKIVSTNSNGNYSAQSTNRFVYDGWNLIAVLNPQLALVRSFVWGLDLSGSLQGAGGVGGLLEVNDAVNGVQFAAYDGNGNVAAQVAGASGTTSAQYEYGPFGEGIRATGPMAKANPFRFSTKYQDDETDLLYYGYRYYNTSTGRWISRDPLGEDESANLSAFVSNNPVGAFDPDGQCEIAGCPAAREASYAEAAASAIIAAGRKCNNLVPAYNPTDEHDPCCCKPPASIQAYAVDDGSGDPNFKMKIVFTQKTGCYEQMQIRWTTCYRQRGAYGVLPSCNDSESCTFPVTGMHRQNGSWMIGIWIDWLSCKNGSWERGPGIHLGLNCHMVHRFFWPFSDKWVCN
jgi:RHS repeat-associated protein